MRPMTHTLPALLAAASALAIASAAAAEEAGPAPAVQAEAQADAETVLSLEDLENLSGGSGVHLDVVTGQTLTAINAGNSVSGHTIGSGQINLATGGLSDFSGIGNFVMNTGHNNNLQSSLNVSIVMAP